MNHPHNVIPFPANPQIEARLRHAFSEPVLSFLIQCVRDSYKTVSETHDPVVGFNNQTFGFNIYHVCVFNLRKAISEFPDVIVDKTRSNVFRLGVEEFELGVYRVGQFGTENIFTSFPTSNGGVKTMVPNSYLPGLEPDISQARRVILAHMGNPEDLLCAAYLCIPTILDKNDRVSEWGYALPIFTPDQSVMRIGADSIPAVENERTISVERKNVADFGTSDQPMVESERAVVVERKDKRENRSERNEQ